MSNHLTENELVILADIRPDQFTMRNVERVGISAYKVAEALVAGDPLPPWMVEEVSGWAPAVLGEARTRLADRAGAERHQRLEGLLTDIATLLAGILAELRWQGRDDPMNTVPKPAAPKATKPGGALLPPQIA